MGKGGSITVWYNLMGQKWSSTPISTDRLTSLAVDPTGLVAAIGCHDKTVRLWDVRGRRALYTLEGHDGPVYAVAFSPDGRTLASAGADGSVRVWDVANGRLLRTAHPGRDPVLAVAFDPTGGRFAAGGDDRRLVIWDTATWKPTLDLREAQDGPIRSLAFSPDGRTLATTGAAGDAQSVRLRDVGSGRLLKTLKLEGESQENPTGPFASVAFRPDGRELVAACASGNIAINGNEPSIGAVVWDVHSGAVVHTLTGHVGPVYQARFSPDGHRIITAGDDHTVKVWDSVLGTETLELRRDVPVVATAMTPDGFRLLAACWDGSLVLWDATPVVHVPGQGAVPVKP
jgi:WD40 repeat protein